MADERTIRIVVDRSQATAELAALEAQLKSVGASAASAGAAMGATNSGAAQMARGLRDVETGSHAAGAAMDGLGGKVREIMVLMREASMGNFTRMSGSATILGQKFGLIEGAIKFASTAVGAWTLGIGVAAVALLGFIFYTDKHRTALEKATDKLKEHQHATEIDAQAQEAFSHTLEGVNKVIMDIQKSMKEYEDNLKGVAQREYEQAEAALKTAEALEVKAKKLKDVAQGQLLVAMGDPNRGTNLGTPAQAQADHLQERVDYFASQITGSDKAITTLKGDVEDAKSKLIIEQETGSEADKINKRYALQEDLVRRQAVAHHKVGDELKRQIDLLEAKRKAEVNAAEEAERATKNSISPQQAILREGLQAKAEGFSVIENPNFGGVHGGHNGQGHADGRAIDVSAVPGNDVNVAWANAKDTALAMQAASKGFIALYNGKRYSSDGHGGYTTSDYPASWGAHTDHVHIEARGPMSARGLGNPGTEALRSADDLERQARALDKSNTKYTDMLTRIRDVNGADDQRSKILAQVGEQVQSNYEANLRDGTISQAAVDLKVKEAKAAEALALDSQVQLKSDQRHVEALKQGADAQAQIRDILAGNNKFTTQMADLQAVEDAKEKERKALKADGADLDAAATKAAIDRAGADKADALALEHQRDALRDIVNLGDQARKNIAQRQLARGNPNAAYQAEDYNFQKQMADENSRYQDAISKQLSPAERSRVEQDHAWIMQDYKEQHAAAIIDVANAFKDKMMEPIQQIGAALEQIFGGDLGKALNSMANGIAALVAGPKHDPITGQAIYTSGFANLFQGMQKSLTTNQETLTKFFGASATSAGGWVTKLGEGLGKASSGAEEGAMIASIAKPLAKLVGVNYSTTGSEIGGAIGGLTGNPLIAAATSLIGGLVGGLFRKSQSGSTTTGLDNITGQFTVGSITGNDDKSRQAASDLANSIANSVNSIMQNVQGQLQGAFSEAVKVKNGKYYINGQSFKDEGDAVFFGVKSALQATLTGVSAFTTRILNAATKDNLNSMVTVASQYEQVLTDLGTLKDPMTAGVQQFTQTMNDLYKHMQAAGATADELQNVTEYRELKLKDMLTQNLQSLKDFQKSLTGDGSGITDLNRLNSDLAQFRQMEATNASGGVVNQNDFVSLGQEIFKLAGSVYGTSTASFQDIRSELVDATNGMIDSVTKAFNDATVAAITTTNQILDVQTQYLAQIAANTGGSPASSGGTYGGGGSAANGRYTSASY